MLRVKGANEITVRLRDRLVTAVEQAVADPEFQATATQKLFAPIRYLPPAKYEAELREGDAQFRKMWKTGK